MDQHQHLSLDGRETARIAGQTDGFERLSVFTPAPEQIPGQIAIPDAVTFCEVWSSAERHAFNRAADTRAR